MEPVHTRHGDTEALVFPGAITLRVLLSGSQTGGSHAVFADIVEPGIGPGRHIHHEQDETVFFLDDNFVVEVGGVLLHVEAGDIAFIPTGTVHAFKNVGTARGRVRYVFSPALSAEAMFQEFFSALEGGSFSEDIMAEIASRHGQEFVGPPI